MPPDRGQTGEIVSVQGKIRIVIGIPLGELPAPSLAEPLRLRAEARLLFRRIIAAPAFGFPVILAFTGCVLVSGVAGEGVSAAGLLIGLGSGVGYGLYSILGTVALRRYSPYTVTTYTFLLAAVGSWLICRPADLIAKLAAAANTSALILLCCLTALVTAVIPFLAYTLGLRSVEASRAGILATVEPMVAALIGGCGCAAPRRSTGSRTAWC